MLRHRKIHPTSFSQLVQQLSINKSICQDIQTSTVILLSINFCTLPSVSVLLLYHNHYREVCSLSSQNSHVHQDGRIRHFVEVEQINRPLQHPHCRMYPTHLSHQNRVSQTAENIKMAINFVHGEVFLLPCIN